MMSESKNSPTRNVTSGSPTFQLAAIGKSLRSSPMRLCGWTAESRKRYRYPIREWWEWECQKPYIIGGKPRFLFAWLKPPPIKKHRGS